MSGAEEGDLISSILEGVDDILSVRDSIGAVIRKVFFVTRTYYQDAALTQPAGGPEGSYAKDSVDQMLPSPGMKEFNQDVRLREGGSIKAGDIILTGVSRNKFKQSDLDGTSPSKNVMKLYMIGDKIYQVINVSEKYVTFNVQIRELTNQRRF